MTPGETLGGATPRKADTSQAPQTLEATPPVPEIRGPGHLREAPGLSEQFSVLASPLSHPRHATSVK